jgi:hypothetical protein
VRLDVRLACDLANVPPAAADAFKASAGSAVRWGLRGGPGARAAYAEAAESPRPVEAPGACSQGSHHSLAPRAARSVSDAAASIASVLIVAEAERAKAERLVGAHRASVNDKDPVAPVVVAGRLEQPVIVASGMEAGDFFAAYGRVKRGR